MSAKRQQPSWSKKVMTRREILHPRMKNCSSFFSFRTTYTTSHIPQTIQTMYVYPRLSCQSMSEYLRMKSNWVTMKRVDEQGKESYTGWGWWWCEREGGVSWWVIHRCECRMKSLPLLPFPLSWSSCHIVYGLWPFLSSPSHWNRKDEREKRNLRRAFLCKSWHQIRLQNVLEGNFRAFSLSPAEKMMTCERRKVDVVAFYPPFCGIFKVSLPDITNASSVSYVSHGMLLQNSPSILILFHEKRRMTWWGTSSVAQTFAE